MLRRRQVLRLLAAAPFCALVPRSVSSAPERKVTGAHPAPRYMLQVFMRGGIDPVYLSAPKTRKEVASWVDVPYRPSEIHVAAGNQFGPAAAPLKRHQADLLWINNVATDTANHTTGCQQFVRLKTRTTHHMPSLLDIVARHRDSQPLGTASLGVHIVQEYSAQFMSLSLPGKKRATLLDQLVASVPRDLQDVSDIQRGFARELRQWKNNPVLAKTASHLEQTAALLKQLPQTKALSYETWSDVPIEQDLADDLQRALWLLENDLTRCIFFRAPFMYWFDTHAQNARQLGYLSSYFKMLSRFIDELKKRTNGFGNLFDNTLMVAGSEVGRFPKLNAYKGKDHFTETTMIMAGGPIRGGQVAGKPGRMMEGLPVSLKTGKADQAGRVIRLGDIGRSLLEISGLDHEMYGYGAGDNLGFLVRS